MLIKYEISNTNYKWFKYYVSKMNQMTFYCASDWYI